MDFFVAALIVAPAVYLAVTRSTWLMDYTIAVIAFNRLIRRLVDYYVHGQFNPFSVISLTPLIVACLMGAVALFNPRLLVGRARKVVLLIVGAVVLGFAVGLLYNRLGAIFSLGEWGAGIGAMAFAASHARAMGAADRWIKTAGWCAVGVAAYGCWQYFTIPPWDAMWLVQSNMVGYMGLPEPQLMTCFSTMNERGVCAGFLGMAMLPMLLNGRWRNIGGWFSVILILYAIFLTEVRSILIIVVLVAVLQPVLARGFGLLRVLIAAIVLTLAAAFGLGSLPGTAKYAARFETDELTGRGSSLDGRIEIYRGSVGGILRSPLGRGLGSSGMASNRMPGAGGGAGDAGYLQILMQFGWVGSALFFGGLALLWKELSLRWNGAQRFARKWPVDPFLPAARAMFFGTLVYLFVADIFSGFSLIWVFFGRALHLSNHPAVLAEYFENTAEPPAAEIAPCELPAR